MSGASVIDPPRIRLQNSANDLKGFAESRRVRRVDRLGSACQLRALNVNRLLPPSVVFCLAAWLLAGGTGFSHGAFHERIAELSKQIAAEPRNARLYLQRADSYRQHEEWQAALADCDKARELDPAIEADLLRGRTLQEAGRPADALPLLDGFLGRHPEHPQALTCRARSFEKLGRHSAAIADYRKALKHTPIPEPDLVLETANVLAAQGAEAEAVPVLNAGIEKLGQIPSLVLRAMELEIATKNFDAALGRVESMRQTAPRAEPWMARRASILAQAGRIPESRAAWQALVEHLTALPNLERGSHAMSKLMEEAKKALAALDRPPASPAPP